jgi:GNAT superfamily N-acetyltransferase
VANLPSARGASFLHTWAELRSQVHQGLITRDELEVRLDAEACAILDEKINPNLEYPLRAVDQLVQLAVDLRGRARPRRPAGILSRRGWAGSHAEEVRNYRPDQDGEALSDLWGRVFGAAGGGQTVDWLFRSGPAGNALRAVMEVGGRIVAHAGVAPIRFMLGGQEVRGAYSIGAMTDPEMQGRGYFVRLGHYLYKRLEEEGFAFVAGFSNWNSYRLMTGPLGRVSVGPFPWGVRVLKPFSLMRSALGSRAAEWPHRVASFTTYEEDGVTVSAADLDDPRIDTVWSRAKPSVSLGGVRDAAFARWRFASRPDSGYRLLVAERAGVPAAYLAARPRYLHGIRASFLVDFVLADGEEAAGRVLLRSLAKTARTEGAEILSALLPGSGSARRVLRRAGFLRVPERLHPQLVRFSVRALGRYAGHPTLMDPSSWFLSWADTDVV